MAQRGSGLAALLLPELPDLPDPVEFLDVVELAAAVADGAMIVDVRSEEERADGFLAGSFHVPFEPRRKQQERTAQGGHDTPSLGSLAEVVGGRSPWLPCFVSPPGAARPFCSRREHWDPDDLHESAREVAELAAGSGALCVFHCMYSRERGPRAAQVALELRPTLRAAVLRGGFQRALTQLWDGYPGSDGSQLSAAIPRGRLRGRRPAPLRPLPSALSLGEWPAA
ncbi:unnamed protein product [Prorocentrum cordatum]|uniref:Rhodanese domain-containing protein n=1 Tax=Prorocentrum cordatum TaxID=2364126 RepID=A0ABN9TP90_9DINO|nr:unnamed protein product [Polarella glacialis]